MTRVRDTGAVVEGGRRPKSPWREKWAGAHAHYMSFRSSSAADRGRSFCPRFSAFFCRLVLRVGGGRLRHSTGKHKSRWPRARTGGGGRPPGPAWCRRRGSGPVVRGGAVSVLWRHGRCGEKGWHGTRHAVNSDLSPRSVSTAINMLRASKQLGRECCAALRQAVRRLDVEISPETRLLGHPRRGCASTFTLLLSFPPLPGRARHCS